jgi:hypothetical protein
MYRRVLWNRQGMCSGMNNGESGAGPLSSGRISHRGVQRGTDSRHSGGGIVPKYNGRAGARVPSHIRMSQSFLTLLDDDGELRSPVRTSSKHPLLVNWRKD